MILAKQHVRFEQCVLRLDYLSWGLPVYVVISTISSNIVFVNYIIQHAYIYDKHASGSLMRFERILVQYIYIYLFIYVSQCVQKQIIHIIDTKYKIQFIYDSLINYGHISGFWVYHHHHHYSHAWSVFPFDIGLDPLMNQLFIEIKDDEV